MPIGCRFPTEPQTDRIAFPARLVELVIRRHGCRSMQNHGGLTQIVGLMCYGDCGLIRSLAGMGQMLRIHHDQLGVLGLAHAIELAIMQEELVAIDIFDVHKCRGLVQVRISRNEQLDTRLGRLVIDRDMDRVDEQDASLVGGKLEVRKVALTKTLPLVHSSRTERSLLRCQWLA